MTMRAADIKLAKKDCLEKGTTSKKKKPANRSRYEFKQPSPRGAHSRDRVGTQDPRSGTFHRTASQHHISTMFNSMRPAIQQRQSGGTNKKRKNLKRLSYPIQKDKNQLTVTRPSRPYQESFSITSNEGDQPVQIDNNYQKYSAATLQQPPATRTMALVTYSGNNSEEGDIGS